MKLKKKKNIPVLTLLFLLAIVLLTWALYHITGVDTGCYTKAFTGFPCPGCGMTRAWLCALRFDFKSAFFYHPLFFLPVIVVILLFLEMTHNIKAPGWVYIILLSILIGTYFIRMILYFPDTEPMTFNPNAYLPKLIWRVKFLLY